LSYEKRPGILTPLKRHGKVIGILVVDSVALSEYFVPTVKNLSHHISAALELAFEQTERKKIEETLREYMEKLEEKVEERTKELKETHERLLKSERLAAIGEAATMVGHDLRNPLQSIENATYYLNRQLAQLPSSVKIPRKTGEMLQVIKDSVDYADKIIRDLNDFSATREATLTKTDMNALVKESLSQVEPPRNVEFVIELGRLPEIEVDTDMIKRIFLNLAANGIQAMENGGTLKVSTKNSEGFISVSFKDDGVGISEENIKNLFTPFFTTKARGLGIGLAICRRFAEANGGSINVETKKGEGSTFTVRLPIQRETGGENL
jgi:signal transduction histidine kinase